jgi:hypothetical protein
LPVRTDSSQAIYLSSLKTKNLDTSLALKGNSGFEHLGMQDELLERSGKQLLESVDRYVS